MKQITVSENEAGKRFDKFLTQYLSKAPSGFIYKMLRKKNIVLNDKKADGKEKLVIGDDIKIWLSDETFLKFASDQVRGMAEGNQIPVSQYRQAFKKLKDINVLYENHHVVFIDKPVGILTQKAEPADISLNEWLVGYLLNSGAITPESLATFRPSVCNRLDRNTSGIVICAKTLPGAQTMAKLLKDRTLQKYYRTVVKGIIDEPSDIDGFVVKDEEANKVTVLSAGTNRSLSDDDKHPKIQTIADEGSYIQTSYRPLSANNKQDLTYLEVELKTGKTHQIRAHLASIGHPLCGDYKYGDADLNEKIRSSYGIKSQLLHCCRVVFPEMQEGFEDLSGREIIAPLPSKMNMFIKDKFKSYDN